MVLDGQEQKQYDGGSAGYNKKTLRFSPDSQRLAHGAKMDGKSFGVVDGPEG